MKALFFKTLFYTLLLLLQACASDDSTPESIPTEEIPIVETPEFNSTYAAIVNQISPTNLATNVQTYEDFGIKNIGTLALENAQQWITETYRNYGYTAIELQEFPALGTFGNNIIITKKGTRFPNSYIILDAHYDTVYKGANDNGSGTTLLLEIARLLKGIDTEYSIKFIHFSGEEDGLIGSYYYVQNVVKPTMMDIQLVLNVDQVGGLKGANKNVIVCEKGVKSNDKIVDQNSEIVTNALAKAVTLYTTLTPEIDTAFSSDYEAFELNKEVITGLFEKNGTQSPHYHQETDLLENMDLDYFTEVTKAATAAILHFAVAQDSAL